jgi:hypothetical protein
MPMTFKSTGKYHLAMRNLAAHLQDVTRAVSAINRKPDLLHHEKQDAILEVRREATEKEAAIRAEIELAKRLERAESALGAAEIVERKKAGGVHTLIMWHRGISSLHWLRCRRTFQRWRWSYAVLRCSYA